MRLIVGLLIGAVGLVGMIRLVGGGFGTAGPSLLAWLFLLVAMLPWVVYCGWRTRRSAITPRGLAAAALIAFAGAVGTLFGTGGAVLAVTTSLVAFALVWRTDRHPRPDLRHASLVRLADLERDESDPAADDPVDRGR